MVTHFEQHLGKTDFYHSELSWYPSGRKQRELMPNGEKANDPNTPYYVYEFSYKGKVFYVGHTYHWRRSHGRWGFVNSLLAKGEAIETISPLNNRVLAALIEADLPEHLLTVTTASLPEHSVKVTAGTDAGLWEGRGKKQAKPEERKQIAKRLAEHPPCVLANDSDLPPGTNPATLDEVLRYLGVTP